MYSIPDVVLFLNFKFSLLLRRPSAETRKRLINITHVRTRTHATLPTDVRYTYKNASLSVPPHKTHA